MAAGLALPRVARAASSLPNPIPGGLDILGNGTIYHLYLPGTGPELATITDFNGALGVANVNGPWSSPSFPPPPGKDLIYQSDMRFMQGEYVGRDGRHHHGTFALV
jgi:hypothetical protein